MVVSPLTSNQNMNVYGLFTVICDVDSMFHQRSCVGRIGFIPTSHNYVYIVCIFLCVQFQLTHNNNNNVDTTYYKVCRCTFHHFQLKNLRRFSILHGCIPMFFQRWFYISVFTGVYVIARVWNKILIEM